MSDRKIIEKILDFVRQTCYDAQCKQGVLRGKIENDVVKGIAKDGLEGHAGDEIYLQGQKDLARKIEIMLMEE